MNRSDSTKTAEGGCAGLSGEALERHIFLCPECRGRVRLSAAWDALRGDRSESDPPVGEAFLARVRAEVARDAARRRLQRWLLAAAAVLLFFFAAGVNSGDRTGTSVSPEEEYAGLTAPSATLEGLLPE